MCDKCICIKCGAKSKFISVEDRMCPDCEKSRGLYKIKGLKCDRCGEVSSLTSDLTFITDDKGCYCSACNLEMKKMNKKSQKKRYNLIPTIPWKLLAEVGDISSKKHGDNSWRKGLSWLKNLQSIQNHLDRYKRGEDIDLDDGQHPLASILWRCLMQLEFEETHPELDDRLNSENIKVSDNKYWTDYRKCTCSDCKDKGIEEFVKPSTITWTCYYCGKPILLDINVKETDK
mgnify:CR=1 FL=1